MLLIISLIQVHWLQEPTRILCSQVFLSPVQNSNTFSSNTLEVNDFNSVDTSSLNSFSLAVSVCVSDNLNALDKCHTNPLDVPPPSSESSDGDRSFAYSDSGYSGTDPWNASCSSYCPYNSSTRSSFGSVYSDRGESSRKFSTDSSIMDIAAATVQQRSDGNLQRRIMRNVQTSFENRKSISDCIGYVSENIQRQQNNQQPNNQINGGSEGCVNRARRCSEQIESRSNPEMFRKRGTSGDALRSNPYGPGNHRASGKRSKLGLAVCITLSDSVEDDMQLFCSEHILLLESMLCRLRATAETAYNRKKFYQIMLRAWLSTTEWIMDLFTAPRLNNPVWLTLSCGYLSNPAHLAQSFMNELCYLLNSADTKDTNL